MLKEINSVAKNCNSHLILVEVLILQSRFALLKGDLSKESILLDQARSIADENRLISLNIRVSEEKTLFLKNRKKWEKIAQIDIGADYTGRTS